MSRSAIFMIAIFVLILFGSAHQALAQAPISAVEVSASTGEYNGPCPAHIRFTGKIYVETYPLAFNYEWERSDGSKSPLKVMKTNRNTRTVTTVQDWQVGARGKHQQIWMKLRVRTGNTNVASEPARVVINCR